INREMPDTDSMLKISGLKNLTEFEIPNGNFYDFEHLFGSMDITYHNKGSQNHADVSGWTGDLVDLISMTDAQGGFPSGYTFEQKVEFVRNYRLGIDDGAISGFGIQDIQSDLDVIHIMDIFYATSYQAGTLAEIFANYFTEDLTDADRAEYFLDNRLDGISVRSDVREAVYNAYISNNIITTLEGTEDIKTDDIITLRKVCCYAFADYVCSIGGDYVDKTENEYYSVFSSETSVLAPGITQKKAFATTNDGKQIAYYIATADITRDDVTFYANYNDNDPSKGWAMQRVLEQANAAQEKYGNPESENYIENYNVIVATNGAGYNMATGEPSGLLAMNGVIWQECNSHGFFAILKDGTPMIGTYEDYKVYRDQIQEGISGFGSTLVKDGKISVSRTDDYYSSRASRTAIGITKTGKVVMMVLDGRQEPWSCGGSMEEIAQIMLDAGCVEAINLDGGGSTTYVSREEGSDGLAVVNRPSDGSPRSVSASLMVVSTAPSSTAFDHAVIESDTDSLTVGASMQLTPKGVSATGNSAELPEGLTYAVSNDAIVSVDENGMLTAKAAGEVDVFLMQGDVIVGTKTVNVVSADNIYFTTGSVNAVYGKSVALPVKLAHEGKNIAFTEDDIVFTVNNASVGYMNGLDFVVYENTLVKTVSVTAALACDPSVSATININLFNEGEVSFDFDNAIGGDRLLAWDREVSNSTTDDNYTYVSVKNDEDMVTSYTFALDMREIPIPEQLTDLISMLPGHDMEGASAWMFLMTLAERVSVLTTVTATIQIDPAFDVDYSELIARNDYFEQESVYFDPDTSELVLTMRWIDQTAAIDPDTSNPLFILNGIKLTPKADAEWTRERLEIVNSGEISYEIYLRANALYSFAQKVDNQGVYGLYPFINPANTSEKGGYFMNTYATFEDRYVLVNKVKEGWVLENGGYAYYVDGEKLTGVAEVDGIYYDFGENGISKGEYDGIFQKDGKYYFARLGVMSSGWFGIGDGWYYFLPDTYEAAQGRVTADNGITFDFVDGRVQKHVWEDWYSFQRCWYGPSYYYNT
ncbi:MAG: phosphodiester glycosidase family protein, partial [Clostridia bacterium]|nr:phosphodiester glycosidase family protein [Clostridia bacterium]